MVRVAASAIAHAAPACRQGVHALASWRGGVVVGGGDGTVTSLDGSTMLDTAQVCGGMLVEH